jgi:hypothetical protein
VSGQAYDGGGTGRIGIPLGGKDHEVEVIVLPQVIGDRGGSQSAAAVGGVRGLGR